MRPIGHIGQLRERSVLYHSAFGFASVVGLESDRASLEWEVPSENLPTKVPAETLVRIYAQTPEGGFFWRSVHDRQELVRELAEDPAGSLAAILADLNGPQRSADVRDWLLGRKLMSASAFGPWWRTATAAASQDTRFDFNGDAVSLRSPESPSDPHARLATPMLSPGRRLDLAVEARNALGESAYLEQVLTAWRTGGTQVRELALAAVRDFPADAVFRGLLAAGPEGVESILHAIRRGPWTPEAVSSAVHAELVDVVVCGTNEGGPLDVEGRLAAALCRWGSPVAERMLSDVASTMDGRRLIRATLAALPARRGEQLALVLLSDALGNDDPKTARWLASEALGLALVEAAEMADRLDSTQPALADWFRNEFRSTDGPMRMVPDDSLDDTAHTAEIDLSGLTDGPISLADLPARSGASLLGLGLAMARALAHHHKDQRIVNPTARTCRVLPDETMEIDILESTFESRRPEGEHASAVGDVAAGAMLLLECMLARPWPHSVLGCRAIPYLRAVIPHLAPSVLAPLDAALHPDSALRPADGLAWLAMWQQAALAEEKRGYTVHDPAARTNIGYDSHIGRMKVLASQTNQDAIFANSRGPISLLVLCDGISTANAGSGDVASSIASHVVANLWEVALPRLASAPSAEVRDFLDRALKSANAAVCDAALRFAGGNLDGRVPMGTTVVLAIVHGNVVHLAWLGDSRAYLVGPYGASLITADENQACERLKAWHLSYVDHWEPAGFALVGYLGHFNELLRAEALPAHHITFTLIPGERLLLCSDGVTDYVGESHPEVAAALATLVRQDDLDEAARGLVALANRGGGGDNCSAIIASLW